MQALKQETRTPEVDNELGAALQVKDARFIGPLLARTEAADIAQAVRELDDERLASVFLLLRNGQRAETFSYLEQPDAERLVAQLGHDTVARVLDELAPDDRARFFKHLPDAVGAELVPLLAQAERNDLRRLLSFPEGSAGSVMSTDYATVPPGVTAREAIEHLRRIAPRSDSIYNVYVTDETRRLRGSVRLVDLITAPSERPVEKIMDPDPVHVSVHTDREEVARAVAKYDVPVMPVVDDEGRLLGVVTHDDVLDVVEAEQAEDFEKASGLEPDETPYDRASIFSLFRRRVLWLVGLMLAGLLASTVIAAFEGALATAVALALFIPVVTGSGGNTGTQSATLIIRGMATGAVSTADWLRVLCKELLVGLTLGSAMALAILLVGRVWPAARPVAPVVAVTMVALVVWANLLGALMPMALRRLGIDPAVAGAPLVATLVDATGLLIYFSIATVLLPL